MPIDPDPPSKRRDPSITLVCAYCGAEFHPWKFNVKRGKSSQYCSRACRSKGLLVGLRTGAEVQPMPVRDGAVVMVGSNPVEVANSDSAETVIELAGKVRKVAKLAKGETRQAAQAAAEAWRISGEHWDRVAAWYAARQTATAARRSQAEDSGKLIYTTVSGEGRTVTLSGYGARLTVKGSALQVVPGRTYITQQLETESLYRGIHGVSSITWVSNGGAGLLTLEAIKWCASQGITIRLLTNRGEHLGTLFPSPDAPQALGIPQQENGRADIALRRAQYALKPTGNDVPLARQIILRKLAAQRVCLDQHPELPERERGYEAIDMAAAWLSLDEPTPATSTVNGIRIYESRGANGYYACWRGLPLKLDTSAEKKWPPPWKQVAKRNSPLTRFMSPRSATNPAQAALNFVYAMLESQVRQALNAIGADVSCGVLHSDQDGRDSLVYDIMEGLRGEVDHLLLEFIGSHVFGAGDFNTMSSGAVTIHPVLCRVLAEMVRVPQRHADDEARWFRSQVLGHK